MKKNKKNREQQKEGRITKTLFITLVVCLIGAAFLISGMLKAFVGETVSDYRLTDTSITVDLKDYEYVILRGYIVKDKSVDIFSYSAQTETVLYEDILKAEGVSAEEDVDITFAKISVISNWHHPWLHELFFVLGMVTLTIIPIPFCIAIHRLDNGRKEEGVLS